MSQVLIVAAEASSALFATRLLEHWKSTGQQVQAFGVGDQNMENLGFERLGKSEEMAVVGAAEIIEQYGKLKAVFNSLVEQASIRKPQVAIVMDYPEFNLMLSKKLHQLGIPVVYYISPQVWAWRKGRVETIKKYCHKVFVLFPFEVAFYKDKKVPCEFVGHPVLDEMNEKFFSPEYLKTHRQRYGIQGDEFVVGLMPGSRQGELKQHLDLQIEVARRLYKRFPKVRILVMCAPTIAKEHLQERMNDVRFPYMLLKEEPLEMIHLADAVLVASGTATLMVGLLEKPMVIMYKMKWLTGIFAKVFIRGVKFFGLVNLILNREAVPERWQAGANPDELFRLMSRYIQDPAYKESVIADLKKIRPYLGEKGATLRVAKALEPYLQKSNLAEVQL
jgi:lipid-A-disaccharide synthase